MSRVQTTSGSTKILGISAFYHDSAAALIVDGEIVAAAQEERFTRKKHDHHFPSNAIAWCLREAGVSPVDIDYVGFYDKPLAKFDRLIETYAAFAPASFASYLKALPLWLKSKLHLQREMDRALNEYRGPLCVLRSSRVPCGERVLSIAIRRSGDPDARRRRRVVHHDTRVGPRQSGSATADLRRSFDGNPYLVQQERNGAYPGGPARARQRREIMTRNAQPRVLACLREGLRREAWQHYRVALPWHIKLRRWKFLVGFPVRACLDR